MAGGATPATVAVPVTAAAGTGDDNGVSDAMLATTVATLQRLGAAPDTLRLPRFRALRAAIFPLVKPADGKAAIVRVSEALSDARWGDARAALLALQAFLAGQQGQHGGESAHATHVKLGTLQRWVRECDLAGGDDAPRDALLALDLMLRIGAPEQVREIPANPAVVARSDARGTPILRPPPLELVPAQPTLAPSCDPWQCVGLDGVEPKRVAAQFAVLLREDKAARRPPNLHDMILYRASPRAVPIALPEIAAPRVRAVPVDAIPLCQYFDGLLSPQEATTVLQVAETVGFTPDVPLTNTERSVLAHHFVWMADDSFIGNVFQRCKRFLPPTMQGATLHGLNGRLRCYRYEKGAVYRPHVDGAWPESGLDSETGEYRYDVSRGRVTSKFTFLMYLNEGFDGGCTTFFVPAKEPGYLHATAVRPRIGGCLLFPHADAACLVHEGSGVEGGTKYIIRTEVLYRLPDSAAPLKAPVGNGPVA